MGAYPLPVSEIPSVLLGGPSHDAYFVLTQIRAPRVVLSVVVGAALGMAGASLQGLFRNPLAAPSVMGVTSGAGLGASLCIVLLGTHPVLGRWGLPLAAFAGASLAVWLVWRVAGAGGRGGTASLLLAGIAINSLAGAGTGILVSIAGETQLRGIAFWQLGGLDRSDWSYCLVATPPLALGMAILLFRGNALNAMSLGESAAFHLGVRIARVKRWTVVGACLAIGAAVAVSGNIAFVGLVVPHLLRLAVGADHRYLLPASALGGGLLLAVADCAARTVAAPSEMPVGILTSLVGGPFFLYLLMRHRREAEHA